ncbi:MAG: hypothetical protein ABIR67_01575 [Gaiellaceae bacterium]
MKPNESLEAAAASAMRADIAKTKLNLRSVGHLPLDRETAVRELTEEERALRDSRPKTRRWRALEKLDQEVDRMKARQEAAGARQQEAEAALNRAPEEDARRLADWLGGGEKGERPPAERYERERERDAARLLVEAAIVEVDRALERRLQHVEGNRAKMLADARRDVGEARQRLQAHAEALPALRQALLDSRENLLWAASFPERVEGFVSPTAVALGLVAPVKKALGTNARVEYAALVQALNEDARAIAEAFSDAQKGQLGIAEPRSPEKEALWDDDPDNVAWKRRELERARQLAEWHDPERLAAEVRDQRP